LESLPNFDAGFNSFGPSRFSVEVPEPTGLALLTLAVATTLLKRRRRGGGGGT